MTQLLGIEWDERQLRCLVARLEGGLFRAEAAWTIETEQRSAGQLGALLKQSLAEHHASRIPAVVCLGRRVAELRPVELPPSPPEEQPDLVRFQAPREFSALDDDARLDFVEIGSDERATRVLAAALPGPVWTRFRTALETAGVAPRRVAIRSLALGELAREMAPSQPRLLVNIADDEVDLVLHSGELSLAARQTKLPASGDRGRALESELRRTLATGGSDMRGATLAEVVLITSDAELETAAKSWKLSAPVRVFDPFGGEGPFAGDEAPGRYAPLAGLLQGEFAERRPDIDLLHPRQRPKAQGRLDRAQLLGIAAGVLLLLGAISVWWSLRSLDRAAVMLAKEVTELKKRVETSLTVIEERDVVEQFLEADVTWIDELRHLSLTMPDSEETLITKWNSRVDERSAGGSVTLEGYAATSGIVDSMQRRLRDARHKVTIHSADEDAKRTDLPWHFRKTVVVGPEGLVDPDAPVGEAAAAGETPAGEGETPTAEGTDVDAAKEASPATDGDSRRAADEEERETGQSNEAGQSDEAGQPSETGQPEVAGVESEGRS